MGIANDLVASVLCLTTAGKGLPHEGNYESWYAALAVVERVVVLVLPMLVSR